MDVNCSYIVNKINLYAQKVIILIPLRYKNIHHGTKLTFFFILVNYNKLLMCVFNKFVVRPILIRAILIFEMINYILWYDCNVGSYQITFFSYVTFIRRRNKYFPDCTKRFITRLTANNLDYIIISIIQKLKPNKTFLEFYW